MTASQPAHGVVIARGLRARMRDGVELSTDIYRPALNGEPLPGPFPAIVTRSPYDTRSGKGPSSQQRNGEFFARHGYLYAVTDTRGRFESGGEFVLLDNDGPDGHDVVEWLAQLPYCDGNVGTQGTSLRAWNQNATALERPPHLRCMWINQGGSNGNVTALRHNGALELRWLSWAVTYSVLAKECLASPALQRTQVKAAENFYDWLQRLPWTQGNSPLAALPAWERWAIDLYTHGDADEFWLNPSRNFEPYKHKSADVPTMYAGSWYDSYSKPTIDKYVWFKDRLQNQFLMIGPGIHGGPNFDSRYCGDVDMGPKATIANNLAKNRHAMMLAFYDRWLKGIANEFDTAPKIRIFVMGGGGGGKTAEGRLLHGGDWRTLPNWPPPQSTPTDFYLQPAGKLAAGSPPAQDQAASTFVFNPDKPLPTIAGNVSSLTENLPLSPLVKMPDPTTHRRAIVIQGAADQVTRSDLHCEAPFGVPLAQRADVLVFETEPLAERIKVIGDVEVELFLSSTSPDTDLFAMLLDIYPASKDWPSGYRMNITDGLMRVRYRESMAKPKLMTPGEVVKVRFPLYPTANLFDRGHRIQLLVSSSSFPRFDVNPNTGEPIGRHTRTFVSYNSIHHSSNHASRLILPVAAAKPV